ncbi:hypothetical protein G7Y89_g4948 [Cudoniella acicularis]|uniref:Uncharacterized protein n=1 Tax=Cudoniella acicularis TaxID=354080 RepID=A0A8H4RNF1_9HELO|nr:hypothetical protein G7Y89_g4948 [Cudoniella acicularis]
MENHAFQSPEIACSAEGNTKVYSVATESSLEAWLDETFIIEPMIATIEGLFANFKPGPLSTCHYLPRSSEFLIHNSYWRTGGIGAINLLNNFFHAVNNSQEIAFVAEGVNLTPSVDELAGFLNVPSKEANEEAMALAVQYFGNLPTIGLPTKSNQVPGPTHRSGIKLGVKTITSILATCKANNLTVTTAFHAAFIMATLDLDTSKRPEGKKYTSYIAFNFYPYLAPPNGDPTAHPVTVNMLGLPLSITPKNFANCITQLQTVYKQPLSPKDNNFEAIMAPYIKKFAAIAAMAPPPDVVLPSEPIINSLGVVDKYLEKHHGDKVEIVDFWLGVEMLTRQLDLLVDLAGRDVCFYKKCIGILVRELKVEIGEDWSA